MPLADGYREPKEPWAGLLRSLRDRGLNLKAPVLAVGDGALGSWAALRDVFPTTKGQRYRSAINANIKPVLGKIDIAKLEPAQIDAYYSKLLASGLTPLTVRKSHAILSASFAQALRWGWVDRNPVPRASPPSTHGREINPPTLDELGQLLQSCAEHHPELASLVYTAAATGARHGKLCGLRWSDIDLDTATVTVAP